MFPIKPKTEPAYSSSDFDIETITDFTGGLNTKDSQATLPKNEFAALSELYYTRKGQIHTRPPFRPMTFNSTIQDKPISVDIGGNTYVLSQLDGQEVFSFDVSGWSFEEELHVVWGRFTWTSTTKMVVAVYCTNSETWKDIWSSPIATDTAVSVVSYTINQAFDLIIFPDSNNPERWTPDNGTGDGTLSDLGLTAPGLLDFEVTYPAASANSEGPILSATDVMYYKFAYFYDDLNVTTKFGESPATAVTTTSSTTPGVFAAGAQINIQITDSVAGADIPSGVSKVLIYRAPIGTPEGPYKFIGECIPSVLPDGAGAGVFPVYVDTTALGFEGVENLPPGSDPSASPTLAVLNVRNLSGYLVGFDASMPYKLIWCTGGQPDVWNPLNFDYLDTEGKVAVEFNRRVYAFTESSTYQKLTMGDTAFKISNIGTIDGDSVQDIGHGLMWMDYDTVYFADFVQQYGSKGDFPRDDGHPISNSIVRYDASANISSAFFERRYYLTYVDKSDFIRRTMVFDVDIQSWTRHNMKHPTLAAGKRKLYSIGTGNDKDYVYVHDYDDVTPSGSDYDGKDYHDYLSVTGAAFANMLTVVAVITKSDIHIGGEFRKILVSSISLMVEGSYVGSEISISSVDSTFGASKQFIKNLGTSVNETLVAKWDNAVWAGDMVGHWKMNGNSLDSAINANNGSDTDMAYSSGHLANAADFNGSTSFITIADNSSINISTEDFSVAFWMKSSGTGADKIIGRRTLTTGAIGWEIRFGGTSGPLTAHFVGAGGSGPELAFAGSVNLRDGSWHHVIITFDRSGDATLYADGSVDGTPQDISTETGSLYVAQELMIGAYSATGGASFNYDGSLDDVRLYNKKLSAAEITDIYNGGTGTEGIVISNDATLVEQGWAGTSEGYDAIHKKIRRVMKSDRINITILNEDSRNLRILGFALYYKLLPLRS